MLRSQLRIGVSASPFYLIVFGTAHRGLSNTGASCVQGLARVITSEVQGEAERRVGPTAPNVATDANSPPPFFFFLLGTHMHAFFSPPISLRVG